MDFVTVSSPASVRSIRRGQVKVLDQELGKVGLSLLALTALGAGGMAIHGYGHGVVTNGGNISAAPSNSSGSSTQSPSSSSTSSNSSSSSAGSSSSTKSASGSSSSKVKLGPVLSSTQYAKYAFQIYPGSESSQTKLALAGFVVKVHPGATSETITLAPASSPSSTQSATYAKGDKVYFIEASFSDDSGNNDYGGSDDGVVVTTPAGRIVE